MPNQDEFGYYLNERSQVTELPYAPTFELVGWLDPYSGYGNETIQLAEALEPYVPCTVARIVTPPIPPQIALQMTRSRAAVETSVWFSTPNDLLWRAKCKQFVITMWETDTVPEVVRKNFDHISKIFCPCPASVEAYQKFLPGIEVEVLTFGCEPDVWGPPIDRDWSGKLEFGMIGVLSTRKYAWETFKAFRDAFGDRDDVHLEMMSTKSNCFPHQIAEDQPNITVKQAGHFSKEQLRDWYRSKHVLLFPSRGEGNGRPPMEMGLTGGAVVATGGMGMHWMQNTFAYVIPYKWVPVRGFPWKEGAKWMEPDYDILVDTLRAIDSNRGEARERARNLAGILPMYFDWDNTAKQLMSSL